MGLNLQTTGKHVAFTAGTGVLVVMDLIAYLLIRVVESNGGPSILDQGNRQKTLVGQSHRADEFDGDQIDSVMPN